MFLMTRMLSENKVSPPSTVQDDASEELVVLHSFTMTMNVLTLLVHIQVLLSQTLKLLFPVLSMVFVHQPHSEIHSRDDLNFIA